MNYSNDGNYSGTTNRTILHNLFFSAGDTLYPYLIADNEKFLRELTYLQDVKILPVEITDDTTQLDISIIWKDLFPIGGSAAMGSLKNISFEVNNDNLFGHGDRLQLFTSYDKDRKPNWGSGMIFTKRNIGGSFVNLSLGFQTLAPAFNSGRREEREMLLRADLPLVSPYHAFTGSFEVSKRQTQNGYLTDSIYFRDFNYAYSNTDAWIGYNIGAKKRLTENLQTRKRKFISLRTMNRFFSVIPDFFKNNYHPSYANVKGILGAFSIFEQDYYHTNFLYGFGRNEDVPEGFNISIITGMVQHNQTSRPYAGFEYNREYFSNQKNYVNYTIKFSSYLHERNLQDISLFTHLEYFTRLRTIRESRWYSRLFFSGSVTQQLNTVFNEPLRLVSDFGIPELNIFDIKGSTRISSNFETVFYNTTRTFGFSFAPFVFSNFTYIKPIGIPIKSGDVYTSIGGGCRTRNENLVFGTMELKVFYHTRTYRRSPWSITFNTGLRFKYNSQLLKKPGLINVN